MCYIKHLTCGNIIYVSGWKVFTWTINTLSQINFQFSNDIFSSTPFEYFPIFQWYIYYSLLFFHAQNKIFQTFAVRKRHQSYQNHPLCVEYAIQMRKMKGEFFNIFFLFFPHSIPFFNNSINNTYYNVGIFVCGVEVSCRKPFAKFHSAL